MKSFTRNVSASLNSVKDKDILDYLETTELSTSVIMKKGIRLLMQMENRANIPTEVIINQTITKEKDIESPKEKQLTKTKEDTIINNKTENELIFEEDIKIEDKQKEITNSAPITFRDY